MLKHTGGVLHHSLVIAQLLVASSSVVIASQQRVSHLRILSSALNGLGVLQMRTTTSTNALDSLREATGLEELVALSLVAIHGSQTTDLLLSHVSSLWLGNTKESQQILIIGENLQATIQKLLSIDKLALR